MQKQQGQRYRNNTPAPNVKAVVNNLYAYKLVPSDAFCAGGLSLSLRVMQRPLVLFRVFFFLRNFVELVSPVYFFFLKVLGRNSISKLRGGSFMHSGHVAFRQPSPAHLSLSLFLSRLINEDEAHFP